jgi:2-polyprenyl-6-methoxyphenol hydroxylase-like FAD-dependent oxidoreductase
MSKVHPERTHAIVIGGGIAGLLAARVLINHFERITLIERDYYPAEPVFRAGVPQGRHVHLLLLQGQHTIEALFPGIGAKLLAQGAVERMYGAEGEEASVYFYGKRCPQIPPVLRGLNCSRALLEWQIHQELLPYQQLRILEGHEVVHLLLQDTPHSVCGVQFRARTTSPTNAIQELQGDLVIDASGSNSHMSTWLTELGYEAPRERTIKTCVNYATRTYLPDQSAWKEIAIQTIQRGRHGGVLMEVEQGRWMVVLSATGKEQYPPLQEEQYIEFARQLPDQSLYEAITSASPITPIYGYRKAEQRQHRFPQQPEGFLILGDALCSFNPVYGQGMTVAALEAVLLDRCLHEHNNKKGFAHRFQKKAARLIMVPWLLAAAADSLENNQTKSFRYIEKLIALLPYDRKALLTFLSVIHMLRSPLTLIHPVLVTKVLYHSLRFRRSSKK